jgi:hypothetical protein
MSLQIALRPSEMIGLAIGASAASLLASSGRILTYEEAHQTWPYVAIAIGGFILMHADGLEYVGMGAFAYGLAKTIVRVVSKVWNVE